LKNASPGTSLDGLELEGKDGWGGHVRVDYTLIARI
jgi:hypothetical protein